MSTFRQMGHIFARYESVDPTIEDDDPLVAAVGGGHAAVVQRLLADPRVDPSKYGLYSSMDVVMKCRDGAAAAAVLELLLAHPRVRAAEGLLPCIESGRLALLQRLLREPRVHEAPGRANADADSRSSEAEASTAGRKPADAEGAAGSAGAGVGSYEPEFRYYVLHKAVEEAPAAVLDCLLADPRTDPLAKDTSTRASASKSKLATGRGSGAGEGSGDDGGKDALDAAARYSFTASRPGVARLLHQPCVLRSRLAAGAFLLQGNLAGVSVSAAELQALAWRRRAAVVAAHPLCRAMAGVEPFPGERV